MNGVDAPTRALAQIAQQASTLWERLNGATAPNEDVGDPTLIQRRLDEWCRVVAKGNWETFRKRLAWDGLDLEGVRRALGQQPLANGAALPAWAETLREALVLAATPGEALGAERFLKPERPLPFEELLAPFILVARRRLIASAGIGCGLLSEAAHAALEHSLLAALGAYSSRALHLEFSLRRVREESSLLRIFAMALSADERALYRQFVLEMRGGGLLEFFREYAALARLLATVTDRWVEANAELLQRLAADWPELERVFNGGRELGQVAAVQTSLSDMHRGRRCVALLTFASGRKLVYKPKDLGPDEGYQRLLVWLNDRGAPLRFKVLTIVNRSTYGWVEYVEHLPCRDREEARRYYRRAGMLLCLMYVLDGTDFHWENIIASRDHPVPVDLEMLLCHRVKEQDLAECVSAQVLAREQLAHSVLRTGLLPAWQVGRDGRLAYDRSGLGARGDEDALFAAPSWEHVNTDRMVLEYRPRKPLPRANVPVVDGLSSPLAEHRDAVADGFRQMYRFLVDWRDALLAPDSPLHGLRQVRVRYVHRPTEVYARLQRKLRSPDYLRDGLDRSIQLELLCRALVEFEERPCRWPLVAAERQAIEQEDVPLFTTRADSDALQVAPGQTLAAFFTRPGFDAVLSRLAALDDQDLKLQLDFIAGSLYAHGARERDGSLPAEIAQARSVAEPLAPQILVARALTLAEQLRERAICAPDGSAAWIAPQFLVEAERVQFQPIGYDLYGGVCGISLFLASVEKVTGGAGYRHLALGALQPLRCELRARDGRMLTKLGIGAAAGLGGIAYALVRTGELLDEPTLLEDASRVARLITPDRIGADQHLDVIAGAAGAILGLLAVYDAAGDDEVLQRAIVCGRHLLSARRASGASHRAWATSGGKLLTGFSHGAAGIAYALLRLYGITWDTNLLKAAKEAIAYERSVFSPEASNWPDLRKDDGSDFPRKWCHGAPGIGLARLGGLPALDTPDIRQDIEVALQATQRATVARLDQLCCGNSGRAEILLTTGLRLSRPELIEAARMRAAQIIARAEQTGSFALHPKLLKDVHVPGLFQGTSGIGYTLLRLACPDLLPSVLLWE